VQFSLRIVSSDDSRRVGQDIVLSGPAVIGRETSADIVLDDSSVSRRHASITAGFGGFELKDLQSGNGVWLGERRVAGAVLAPGQTFRIGGTTFECVAAGPPTVGESDRTVILPRPVAGAPNVVPTALERIVLRVVQGTETLLAGTEVTIAAQAGVLGRSGDCALVVDERDVSRRHVELRLIAGGLLVTDLDSAGGTWVDGRQISAEVLRPGGRLRLGARVEFEFAPLVAEPAAVAAVAVPPAAPAPGADAVPAPAASPAASVTRSPEARVAAESPSQFLRAFAPAASGDALATAMLPVGEADFARTVFVPAPAPAAVRQGLEAEGELGGEVARGEHGAEGGERRAGDRIELGRQLDRSGVGLAERGGLGQQRARDERGDHPEVADGECVIAGGLTECAEEDVDALLHDGCGGRLGDGAGEQVRVGEHRSAECVGDVADAFVPGEVGVGQVDLGVDVGDDVVEEGAQELAAWLGERLYGSSKTVFAPKRGRFIEDSQELAETSVPGARQAAGVRGLAFGVRREGGSILRRSLVERIPPGGAQP
jgi:pSer/pThr/pTyr-binding forkhead associated (FHA) protein